MSRDVLPFPHHEDTIKVLSSTCQKMLGLWALPSPLPYTDMCCTDKHLEGSLPFFEVLPFTCSCHLAPDQHDTANNTMTRKQWLLKIHSPHPKPCLASPACAAVFKLTILKLLKRAWQVIYSVAEDSNFTVQRQETQLHQKICPLMEHRFNMITIPRVCGHNSFCSLLPFPKAASKCFYSFLF